MRIRRPVRHAWLAVVVVALVATSTPPALADDDRESPALTGSSADDISVHPDRPPHVQAVSASSDEPLTGERSPSDIHFVTDESPGTETEDQDALPVTEPAAGVQASVTDPDAPVGMPDAYVVANDQVLSVAAPGFLGNDVDLDGEALTATAIAESVDHGTVTAFGDGRFTYTPEAGFVGTDAFQYVMRDASSNTAEPTTVTITVLDAGTTPVGMPDAYVVANDQVLSVAAPGFLGNDVDLDGEALTATVIADAVDHGSLSAFGDGRFTYTPVAGFVGTDSFQYRMRDASFNDSEPVTVTIEVLPAANRAPVGAPDAYSMLAGTSLSVAAPGFLGNDVDLDGEALTATVIVDAVDHGSLSAFGDGRFTYTPVAGFVGTDSFQYRMRDASFNDSEPVTVTIEVLPAANRAPVGAPDAYSMLAGTSLSVAAPGFLGNDVDLDGEALTATVIVDAVDHGSLSAFGDGRFTYTPEAGFVGTDSFQYRMRDASFNDSEPVTVTIEVFEGNRAPIGVDDQYGVVADTTLSVAAPGFLGNDVDLDGEALTATVIADPVDHGSLSAFGDGRFTYTPVAGFVGTDSFQYRMRDASFNDSEPVTVTLVVLDPNVPPVAADDAYAATEDVPLSVDAPGVLGNDVDANGDALQVVSNTEASSGTVVQKADGSFVYTPEADFCGADSYDYTVADGHGAADTATVTITVACVNDPPVAVDDAYTIEQDTTLVVPAADGVLANGDSDVDGDPISVESFDATSQVGGSVSMDPDGAFTYSPAPGFAGIDTFTYTVADGTGGFDTATVTITVDATSNRSIDVELLGSDLLDQAMSGQMLVTNRSGSGVPVQVIDLDVRVEYRRPGERTWTHAALAAGTCQFDPSPTFVVTDEQVVDFSGCQLTQAVPEDATTRITGLVRVFGRFSGQGHADGWFWSRSGD